MGEGASRSTWIDLTLGREGLSGLPHHKKPARNAFAGADRIIHHIQWQYQCHPLWQEDHPLYRNTYLAAQKAFPTYEIRPVNPFMVLRRPADYI